MKKQFLALVCLFPLLFVNLYASCPGSAQYNSRSGIGVLMHIIGYLRDGIEYLIIAAALVMLILAIRDFIKIRKSESFTPEAQEHILRKYLQVCFGAIGVVLLSALLSVINVAIFSTSELGEQSLTYFTIFWIHDSLIIVLEGFALSILSYIGYIIIKSTVKSKTRL